MMKKITWFLMFFIGSAALSWIVIEVSKRKNIDWVYLKYFNEYGLIAWLSVPVLLTLLVIIIYLIVARLKRPKKADVSVTARLETKEEPPLMANGSPIEIDDKTFSKAISIRVGDYQEFQWGPQLLRITVKGMPRHEREGYRATLDVDMGGGLVFGGERAVEVSRNEFTIPIKIANNEEPFSLYFFHTLSDYPDYFRFFRVFVDGIDPDEKRVTLCVFFAQ